MALDKLNAAVSEITQKMGDMDPEEQSADDLQKLIMDLAEDLKKVGDIVGELEPEDMSDMKMDDPAFKSELESLNEAVGAALSDLQKLQ